MARRPFLRYPDRRLGVVVPALERVTEETARLWEEMLAIMYDMPGVGLAANQIGEMQRLAVVDASEGRDSPVRLANPVLIRVSDEMAEHDEASPNLPGVWARVRRPARIRVAFVNAAGEPEERDFEGLWAASVQHQIDHLDGRLFFDRLSPMRRKMLLARALKRARREG